MREYLIKYFKSIIRFLEKNKKNEEINNSSISSLAPKILTDEKDIKNIQPYLDSLKSAIDNKFISNIALTGTYGSGKSTIIRTFQYLNPDYNYLNVSLASFKDNSNVDDDNFDRKLEISILQQIFYHVRPSKIPDSRFKRIINIKSNKVILIAVYSILWIISTLLLFKFDYINKLNPQTWNISYNIDWVAVLSLIIYFVGIGLLVKTIIRFFVNSKISKLSIKGEMELGENNDKSVFNQYLEEIIYFFERTDYNVVVIEDLDRFNNTDIFTKLREINILLNNSKCIEREINFIYAVRDELFTDKNERVKFFEYIIPVIPFINPSNAGEQLTKLINEANLKDVLSTNFTEDVITFIDDIDMRLLTNIFHEYRLYKDNLNENLQQDNLFAIIVYKNMYPDDFGKLHKREGNLYSFLSQKEKYVSGLLTNIDDKIKIKKQEIENINSEKQINISELRAIYINAIHSVASNAISLYIDGSEVTFAMLLEDKHFEIFLNKQKIEFYFYTDDRNYITGRYTKQVGGNFSFSQIEQKVGSDFTYKERVRFIIEKESGKINLLKKEIENLKKKKSEINSWSLSEIFEEINIDPYLQQCYNNEEQNKNNHFYNNHLIRNLILNGYINEHYSDYISLFHGINLTQEDHTFEKKVKAGVISPFNYTLTKVDNIIKKIPDRYFKRDVVLNFDLFDFLSQNYYFHSNKYNTIINTLSNEKQNSIDFIDGYIDREKNIELFIKHLSKSWSNFWVYLDTKSNYTKEKIETYLELILLYTDIEDIVRLNQDNSLTNYLKERYHFLSQLSSKVKCKNVIQTLNLRFTSLETPSVNSLEIFNYVFQNNYYQINTDNIVFLLKNQTEGIEDDDILTSNYTSILKSKNAHIINYVNENINDYLNKIFLAISENIDEAESSIILLLNNDKVNRGLKTSIIKKQNIKLSDLSKVLNPDLQQELIEDNKIESNWENLLTFFNVENSTVEPLVSFMNNLENAKELSEVKIPKLVNEKNIYGAFWKALIQRNDIDDQCYDLILKSSPWWYSNLAINELSEKKVESLIKRVVINPSKESYSLIKSYSNSLAILLIEERKSDFLKIIDQISLDSEDINLILKSNKITSSEKKIFLGNCTNEIIVENKENLMLINQLMLDDKSFNVNDSLIETIILEVKNPSKNRIILFNRYSDLITEVDDFINSLSGDYLEITDKNKRTVLNDNEYNRIFLEILVKRKFISSYSEDKKGLRVYHSTKPN